MSDTILSCATTLVNSGTCSREGCHFQHLKGTKRTSWEASGAPQRQQTTPAPTQARSIRQRSQNQSAQQNRFSGAGNRADPAHLVSSKDAHNGQPPMNSDSQNFHLIHQQIQQMQSQILSILQRDNQAQAIGRGGGCTHCLQKCL